MTNCLLRSSLSESPTLDRRSRETAKVILRRASTVALGRTLGSAVTVKRPGSSSPRTVKNSSGTMYTRKNAIANSVGSQWRAH